MDAEHAELRREAVRATLAGHEQSGVLRHSLIRALFELDNYDDGPRTLAEAAAYLEEAGRALDGGIRSPEARALQAVLRGRVAVEFNASIPGSGGLVRHDHLGSGLVTLADLRALNLWGEVAVLSACETARGDLTIVGEVSHLAGALESSGFIHVVAGQ